MGWPKNTDPSDRDGHTTNPFIGVREQTGEQSAKRAISPKDAEKQLAVELLDALRILNDTSSQVAGHFRSQLLNDVLDVRMVTLDADGVAALEYRTQIGSVAVFNHNAAGNVTVSSSPKGPGLGTQGRGQHLIRPGTASSCPIGSHTVTLYGTAGNVVTIHVYSLRVLPFSGVC